MTIMLKLCFKNESSCSDTFRNIYEWYDMTLWICFKIIWKKADGGHIKHDWPQVDNCEDGWQVPRN